MTYYNKTTITHKELGKWVELHKNDNIPLFKHFSKEEDDLFKEFKVFMKRGSTRMQVIKDMAIDEEVYASLLERYTTRSLP